MLGYSLFTLDEGERDLVMAAGIGEVMSRPKPMMYDFEMATKAGTRKKKLVESIRESGMAVEDFFYQRQPNSKAIDPWNTSLSRLNFSLY